MEIFKAPKRTRITSAKIINSLIAKDSRERRNEANVTMESLAVLFGENKQVLHKAEAGINQVHLGKYLAIIHFLRETCENHPAHVLIDAVGRKGLESMIADDRPTARLGGFLDAIDLTRDACPNHPALPLANYFLYQR